VSITVEFHPFMIDPGTNSDGEEYLAYNRRRWGGDGWTRSLRAAGKRDGVSFANWKVWPNTLHANRLVMLAERHGLGGEVKRVLMRMCYEEGENVSLRATVARAADEANVPGGSEYVMGGEGIEELKHELQNARINGQRVTAVPFYSVQDGAFTFSGAQDTAQWLKVFRFCAEAGSKHRGG